MIWNQWSSLILPERWAVRVFHVPVEQAYLSVTVHSRSDIASELSDVKSKDDIIRTGHSLPIQNIWRQFSYHFHVINSEDWLSEVYWTTGVKQNCGPEYYTSYRIRTSTTVLTHVTGKVVVKCGTSVRPQQRPIFRKKCVAKLWKVRKANIRQIRLIIRFLMTFN